MILIVTSTSINYKIMKVLEKVIPYFVDLFKIGIVYPKKGK